MKFRSPFVLLNVAVFAALALAAACCWAVLSVPYLGLRLEPDLETNLARIAAVDPSGPLADVRAPAYLRSVTLANGGTYLLQAEDVLEEPDLLGSYAAHAAFMERQAALHAALTSGRPLLVSTTDLEGEVQYHSIQPVARPIASLPASFWLQLVVGTGSFLVGMWVWSLRQRDWGAGCFLLSGIAILCFALAAGVYSSRELALGADLFRALSALNFFGAALFGAAMVALFLIYPASLVRPGLLLAPFVLFMGPTLYEMAARFTALPFPRDALYLPWLVIPLEMLGIILMVLVQWWATRGDPAARALLRWLGLSIVICSGAFVVLYHLPFILEEPPLISQGVSFVFFLLIYVGIALGLRRYRLFDLDTWAFRIMFYMSALIAFVFLDAAIISLLQLDAGMSTGIAILAVGFGYLPLRDLLWRRTVGRRSHARRDYFQPVVDVAFAGTPARSAQRWQALLREIFDPLELREADEDGAAADARLEEDGVEMLLPATAGLPAQRLRYTAGGKRLFSSEDLRLARQLLLLLRHAEKSRDAYEMGRTEERRRIAKDLHDDIGAGLLSGMRTDDLAKVRGILHRTMTDLRGIVGGLIGTRTRLSVLLADLRHECNDRFDAAGIELDWMPEDFGGDDPLLGARFSRNLTAVLRETCSNIIVHSKAGKATIEASLDGALFVLRVSDDGVGRNADPATAGTGNGLPNMRRRVEELQGRLDIRAGNAGLDVTVEIPLLAEESHPFQSA